MLKTYLSLESIARRFKEVVIGTRYLNSLQVNLLNYGLS